MKIQSIVEGHGEVEAVPVLIRRLLNECGIHDIMVPPAFRGKQSKLLTEDGLQQTIKLARLDPECAGIIVLFENEDGCPKTLGPQLRTWATAAADPIPCAVVLPHREFEAWFLASLTSLRGKRGIRDDAIAPENPEGFHSAKAKLESLMNEGCYYIKTTDQAALSAQFDFREAYRNSRSFRHLIKSFGELITAMGFTLPEWPPPSWVL